MLSVFVNRKPIVGPWGGGNNFVTALFEHGEKFDIKFTADVSQKFDAILMIDPRYDELGVSAIEIAKYKAANPFCPIVYRVNECDARKGTADVDEMIVSMASFVDRYVFVSGWLRGYFEERGLRAAPAITIYNGVNKQHFHRGLSYRGKPSPMFKPRVVTHHWSNNALKGFDIYEKLDEAAGAGYIDFTYVGRDRGTFKHTKVIAPLFGKELGDAIRDHDVYVSASRWDPGPNHIIECAASELPVLVHKDGGGAVEFVGDPECVYDNFDELMYNLLQGPYNTSKVEFLDWERCVEKYCHLLRNELANQLFEYGSSISKRT